MTPADLSHARWIGGSPCAGKSTIATYLATRGQLAPYHCDDHFERHGARLSASSPAFARILGLNTEARLRQSIDTQVWDEWTAYREELPLILGDIAGIEGPVIAEGAALLPELVAGLGIPADSALWIVPTESFQRRAYRHRQWAWEMLAATSDPECLFDRWMQRDASFARTVAVQARSLGYQVIVVDGTRPIAAIEAEVAATLAPP